MRNSIINPDLYHGKNKKGNFFEGWYFKIVHPTKEYTYCFIPGIFISSSKEYSHSFIQVVKGHEANFSYLRYNKGDFQASETEFMVKVDRSLFSLEEINLNIKNGKEDIFGRLTFRNITKWPDSIINPGSMGFYNYLSFMQCYSQVCAIDGDIEGSLNINGKNIDFTGGKVYIEKNWGKAFPYSYIWVQGNNLFKEPAAITCSIGHVPFPVSSFTGFLIGVCADESFYKFTTINRSTLAISFEKERIILEAESKEAHLKIEADYKEESFVELYAPRDNNMVPIARESLQGSLKVSLYDKKIKSEILRDCCSSAGIEFSGDYRNLYKKK
jgi:hypothetical protein